MRLIGKRAGGGERTWGVETATYRAGRLAAALTLLEVYGGRYPVGTNWAMRLGFGAATPALLRRVEFLNPTGGSLSFSLAMMTVSNGSPGTGNAFLAWETVLAGNSAWRWQGEAPLVGRWLYNRASNTGLVMYVEWGWLTG